MKILTAAQMREVDGLTVDQYSIPSLLLMENAAVATVEAVEKKFGPVADKNALIVCGLGNNGGDGAAIGRQLWMRGANVDLFLLGQIAEARFPARANFDIAQAIAAAGGGQFKLTEIDSPEQFHEERVKRSHDIVFDAMLGTGLTRPAAGIFEEVINFLTRHNRFCPVVAVDIPSGIASDTPELIGPAVRARLTVTFTAPKIANIFPPASDYGGELVVANIGSPASLINSSGSQLNLVERSAVEGWLRDSRRSSYAHKGDVGKVLVVAGSRGKTGAACLAGEGAIRAGAGLVTVATPESSLAVVASRLVVECMTEPLAETVAGTAALKATNRVLELASERDVVAIGPGLGSVEESTRALVRAVVMERKRPMVIDADGLNSLAPWPEDLRGSTELPLIITPHPGEMARLTGKSINDIARERDQAARTFATAHSLIVVLKGSRTVIASPDGDVYVNPTGNSGMATGGTGDVLTGIIAGLLAQKTNDPLAAVIAAVYLHGFAGDIAASRAGVRAMLASDILAHLSDAFIEVGGGEEKLNFKFEI